MVRRTFATYPEGVSETHSETYAIEGMTCRACEIRIQRALARVPGIESATADAGTGLVRVSTSRDVPRASIEAAVARAGEDYRLGSPRPRPWLTRDPVVWRDLAVAVVGVGLLAVFLQASGLTTLADRVGTTATSGSLLVVVLLGLAAGFSTCMALVGGLVLGFSARAAAADGATGSGAAGRGNWARWRPHVAFNAGRVIGFTMLGALTGLLGSAVTLSGAGLAIAMLAVAVVMTLLAVQLSGASPRLSAGLLPTLPDVLSSRLQRVADEGRASGRSGALRATLTASAVGAATYLLPCGFTQAVQVYALSTGSAAQGAAIMGSFALGTTPGLLAIGGLGASLRGVWAARFARFAAVAVFAFALVNVGGALTVLVPGWGSGSGPSAPASEVSANVRLADGVQYLATTQVADGYEPEHAVVYAGTPVVWELTSEALTCASWIRAPELGITEAVLTPGETTDLTFTPTEPGTLTYTCGMGMYSGTIEVIARPA